MSLATAAAWTPRPPAPWMTTLPPNWSPPFVRPKMTCESAQLTGATSSSGSASGTRKRGPLDLRRARGRLVVQARPAPPARVEVRVRDAVALLEGAAERVGRDARAELRHAPRHLVAEDPAVLGQAQRRVAAPEVQVRAAHARERDLDQHRVGLDVGDRDLADLQGLPGTEEDPGR